ncbi:Triosephosphate isomerase [Nymphaea thermarum]|nr:Triosephosphate isomerase [Nymphaea thermarum]
MHSWVCLCESAICLNLKENPYRHVLSSRLNVVEDIRLELKLRSELLKRLVKQKPRGREIKKGKLKGLYRAESANAIHAGSSSMRDEPRIVFDCTIFEPYELSFSAEAVNCWVRKGGAFTGEISAEMLVNLGIPWVILGPSERRLILNEANEVVPDI